MTTRLYRAVIEHPDGDEQEIALGRNPDRISDYVDVCVSMGYTIRLDEGDTDEPTWRTSRRYDQTDPTRLTAR